MKKVKPLIVCAIVVSSLSFCEKNETQKRMQLAEYKSWEDFPECTPVEPDLTCIKKFFIPLSEGSFPFEKETVDIAFQEHETYIAPDWQLTAIHVLEANLSVGNFHGCYFQEDQYADPTPISCPGGGNMLFIGGHPHTAECEKSFVSMGECVDQVPLSEVYDIAIVKAPTSETYLPIAKTAPVIGEEVFLVSNPSFSWLKDEEQEQLAFSYPLVSMGMVLDIQGRAIITNTLAYPGSSGGVLINKKGEVLGVASSLIGHVREQGVTVHESLSDHYTIIVGFTEEARRVIYNNLN